MSHSGLLQSLISIGTCLIYEDYYLIGSRRKVLTWPPCMSYEMEKVQTSLPITTASASESYSPSKQACCSQPSCDVLAWLHFYSPPDDGSKPNFRVTEPSGTGIRNYKHNPVQVLIQDFRDKEDKFSLATHSFTTISNVHLPSIDFSSDRDVQAHYYPEVERIVLDNVKGSQKVVIFDHCIRRITPNKVLQRPVRKVHIDQNPYAANLRAHRHLAQSDLRDITRNGVRLRIINLWRPIKGPVLDHPLALAESKTVSAADLIEVEHIYPDRVGETYAVKHNPEQKFWYWSRMKTSEVILFQCYDSVRCADSDGVKHEIRCAHASFELPNSDGMVGNRESIEVRCLVIG